MKGLGIHVFAGGFTMGVQKVCPVVAQLEIHNFGRETVEEKIGIPFINAGRWEDWPKMEADFVFGNPRCTGFSSITSGYDETIHGASAACTKDIWDLCYYGVEHEFPLIIWESVQQAYSTGRPLLDRLRDEVFVPAGYRIAHLFLNAATFGNAQRRRRYFFVAYKGANFNVEAPILPERHTTVGDVLRPFMELEPREYNYDSKAAVYTPDDYRKACDEDKKVIPHLRQGECFNGIARREGMQGVSDKYHRAWEDRMSDIPFSLHCPIRLNAEMHSPTISSSGANFVHPFIDRFLTVRELSALMGWPDGITPAGPHPVRQIAKGVCPEVGTWLAEQAGLFLSGHWKDEDWDTHYNHKTHRFEGYDYAEDKVKPMEKVFNLTHYAPEVPICAEASMTT